MVGRNKKVALQCETCGKMFNPWSGREATTRTCSKQCNGYVTSKMNTTYDSDFELSIDKTGDCWVWLGPKKWNGYGMFFHGNKRTLAHRHSFETYIGSIPEGGMICHSCDNRACVNPLHLWVGTAKENLSDMARKCRANKKLNKDEVLRIREDARETRFIAAEYGISRTWVRKLRNGSARKHI